MSITIGKIAELAGVSKTTVSRVLNNKADVDPKTREKILSLIRGYDYHPNVFAKSIALQKSNHIGLLFTQQAEYVFDNPFYIEVMRGVSTEVDKSGYYLLLCYDHDHKYVDIYKQKRVDGFILLTPGTPQKNIFASLTQLDAPIVSTAEIHELSDLVYVDIDNGIGAAMAMDHLFSQGHKKIGFIGKPALTKSPDRFGGYKENLINHNIPFNEDWIYMAETSSIESGYQAMKEMLKRGVDLTAYFLLNDMMAIGAIRAVQEAGRRVPEDISIIGFDDNPLAQFTNPPLTTIQQPTYEKGVIATRLLIDYLESGERPQSVVLDCELIVRGSVASIN